MSLTRWFTRAVRRTHRRPPAAPLKPRLLVLEDRLAAGRARRDRRREPCLHRGERQQRAGRVTGWRKLHVQ